MPDGRGLASEDRVADKQKYFIAALAFVAAALLFQSSARAQIYTCTAPDGTRVYSDKKCGSDAKVVKGITTTKRPAAAKGASAAPKPSAELDDLLQQCNAGDRAACMSWTKSGGPNRLRQKEQDLEKSCRAGSMPACEERYCSDGASDECRQRVLLVAAMSGETWYLRDQDRPPTQAGVATYSIRCLRQGSREFRDVQVRCSNTPGPSRCLAASQQGFPRLDLAASNSCSGEAPTPAHRR